MIPAFLRRELRAGFVADEVAERARLSLELAALVGVVGDFAAGGGFFLESWVSFAWFDALSRCAMGEGV